MPNVSNLTVRFTYRGGVIRIIGAGYWRKGKAIYERDKYTNEHLGDVKGPSPLTLELVANYFQHINWRALFIAFFAFYVLPSLSAIALASWLMSVSETGAVDGALPLTLVFGLFWWWLVAPIGSGYLAARLSKKLPLIHALITVSFGFLFQVAKITDGVWWLLPAWALISLAGGYFGASIWRIQQSRHQ